MDGTSSLMKRLEDKEACKAMGVDYTEIYLPTDKCNVGIVMVDGTIEHVEDVKD